MTGRVLLVILLLSLCTVGHFMTPRDQAAVHVFLFKATFLPIILAGLWFGVKGGLVTSLATTALYLCHVQHQLGGGLLSGNLGRTLDILLYNAIALVTGALAESQVRARRKAERLAEERARLSQRLEASYQALQRTTEELLRTEDALRHTDRLVTLGDMAASLAHEVRNPLNGLSGAAEVLCRDDIDNATRSEFGTILQKETGQLNRVVHDFLRFAGSQHRSDEQVDLGELVERAVESVRSDAQARSVAIAVHDPGPIRVRTTAVLLEHVLLCLLRNAVEATPAGGSVTVSGELRGDRLRVAVRDMGEGIAPEAMDDLFEPFFTTKPGGVGLGLFIARRITRGLGGDISAGLGPGSGSEFVIDIPRRYNGSRQVTGPSVGGLEDGHRS